MEKEENQSARTVGQLMRRMQSALEPEYGRGEARAMVRLVFHALKGWDATALVVNEDRPVSDWLAGEVDRVMSRLKEGEPVQYVLGEARFFGLDLHVTPAVLIPRPETAELVDMIVNENADSDLRVLDIGTGSGAIAIALSRNLRFPAVTAIDVSAAALEVARKNAADLHADIDFREADIFKWTPDPSSLDIIVSNPPYVTESEKVEMARNVLEHEPAGALFVPDSDPLKYYRRIADVARDALSPGGRLYLEINPLFADDLLSLLRQKGFDDPHLHPDSQSKPRFITCQLPS